LPGPQTQLCWGPGIRAEKFVTICSFAKAVVANSKPWRTSFSFFVSETNEKVQEHHLFAAFEELQQDGRMANETLIEQSEENNSDKMSKDTTTRKAGRNFRLISMPLMTTRPVYKVLDPSVCH